jgi:hypothetical protein
MKITAGIARATALRVKNNQIFKQIEEAANNGDCSLNYSGDILSVWTIRELKNRGFKLASGGGGFIRYIISW